jgi:DNA-binding CsgD family transcriptional regulator
MRGMHGCDAREAVMQDNEVLFDIRNERAMDLLLNEEVMSVWELVRRRKKPVEVAEIARAVDLEHLFAQRALDELVELGLIEALRARADRRTPTYRSTCERISIGLRADDATDRKLWDGLSRRFEEAADRLAKNHLPLEKATDDTRSRMIYSLPMRIALSEMHELRHRLDELSAFLHMLQERHTGEGGKDDYFCNYRFELQVQPLAEPVRPQPVVMARFVDRDAKDGAARVDPLAALSKRERQVAIALVRGRTRNETADELGIKPGSVATLAKRIYRKLGVSSRVELVRCMDRAKAAME